MSIVLYKDQRINFNTPSLYQSLIFQLYAGDSVWFVPNANIANLSLIIS